MSDIAATAYTTLFFTSRNHEPYWGQELWVAANAEAPALRINNVRGTLEVRRCHEPRLIAGNSVVRDVRIPLSLYTDALEILQAQQRIQDISNRQAVVLTELFHCANVTIAEMR
jgi:hypothetical protein